MTPALGIHPGISYGEYASWEAVRSSVLNRCANPKTMAHGRYAELNPEDGASESKSFGKALHCMMLEPERFYQQYAIAPNIRRNTKEWFSVIAGSPKHFLKEDEFELAQQLIGSASKNRDVSALLRNSISNEISFVWGDKETGLLCKGRVDCLTTHNGRTVIADIKSTRDASHYAFQRDITNFGYYRSMAFYQMGLHAIHPLERMCVLIAIEKTPPYCCAVYELDDRSLLIGETEMQDLLRKYAECKQKDEWPGYASGIVPMTLPQWKVAQHERDNQFTSAA